MDETNALEAILAAADANIPVNEGDYLDEDGLLICGTCHTKKQKRITLFGEERIVKCLCKCGVKQRDEKRAEDEKRQRAMEIQNLRSGGFPDKELRNCTFDADDGQNTKAVGIAKNYVAHFSEFYKNGQGLLFYGPVGSGKSFLAACIANALIAQNIPSLMTNFPRLTNQLSGMYDGKQEYLDSLNAYDLLVIDDLASERNTEYMEEIIFNIIDSRYRKKKPLIVTTNLSAQELLHPADIRKQRIYSRLTELCLPVQIDGTDRRKEKLKENFCEMKNLLGI